MAFVRSRDSWPNRREGRAKLKIMESLQSRRGIPKISTLFPTNYETRFASEKEVGGKRHGGGLSRQ